VRAIRVRYDEHGRWIQKPRLLRTVLIVVAVVIVLWVIGFIVFDMGGTVPGSGEGDQLQAP
jgi:Tfp pilus assembly protein PilO